MSFKSQLCPLVAVRIWVNSSIFQHSFLLYKMILPHRNLKKKTDMQYVKKYIINLKTQDK